MSFIDDILRYNSLSIVGLQKNTGKTVSLNYVLDRLPVERKRIAVTSIGIDGETTDQVTRTQKPEIYLRQGMYFGTSEMHYRQKRIVSELIDVSDEIERTEALDEGHAPRGHRTRHHRRGLVAHEPRFARREPEYDTGHGCRVFNQHEHAGATDRLRGGSYQDPADEGGQLETADAHRERRVVHR